MARNGFTLVEVIIVLALMTVIIALGSKWLTTSQDKSVVENEFRQLYDDLQGVRSQALFRKRVRTVTFSSTGYNIYSSANTAVTPFKTTTLKAPVTVPANLQVIFSQAGFITFSNSATNQNICVATTSQNAVYNSIIMSPTSIQLGQMTNTGCNSASPL
jgi:prepilin-type N-terminal cleavage/methylation domain-containing protein